MEPAKRQKLNGDGEDDKSKDEVTINYLAKGGTTEAVAGSPEDEAATVNIKQEEGKQEDGQQVVGRQVEGAKENATAATEGTTEGGNDGRDDNNHDNDNDEDKGEPIDKRETKSPQNKDDESQPNGDKSKNNNSEQPLNNSDPFVGNDTSANPPPPPAGNQASVAPQGPGPGGGSPYGMGGPPPGPHPGGGSPYGMGGPPPGPHPGGGSPYSPPPYGYPGYMGYYPPPPPNSGYPPMHHMHQPPYWPPPPGQGYHPGHPPYPPPPMQHYPPPPAGSSPGYPAHHHHPPPPHHYAAGPSTPVSSRMPADGSTPPDQHQQPPIPRHYPPPYSPPQPSKEDELKHNLTGRGPVMLYMSCDEESLSAYQCLVRRHIELFEAREIDVESNAQGRNKPIVMGQVGIRCRHCCSLRPIHRARASVYFPAKLRGLYQAAQNMATIHLCQHCQRIPADLRSELLVQRERKSSAGGGKKYWGDGSRVLGVYEAEDGLRFEKR